MKEREIRKIARKEAEEVYSEEIGAFIAVIVTVIIGIGIGLLIVYASGVDEEYRNLRMDFCKSYDMNYSDYQCIEYRNNSNLVIKYDLTECTLNEYGYCFIIEPKE